MFSLAAHDEIDLGLFLEDFLPVIGWEDPAVHDPRTGQRGADRQADLRDDGVGRGRPGVAKEDGVGPESDGARDDLPRGQRGEFTVDEVGVVPRIDKGSADGQKTQWRQVVPGNAAADGRVGDIDEQDAHGS